MKTKIIKINPTRIENNKIKSASKVINNGGLVAFPTETVYGLGADALNENAVKKIFITKGRPADNPLIVHIANKNDIKKLVKEIPKNTNKLINKFFPGPLSLVLFKSKIVPEIISAGSNTVAIRMPENKIALALIKEAKTPIAAPSANLFSKPSPTKASHVIQDLKGKIEMIIDGGETRIGLESTVLDMTTKPPTLLRPGGINLEELRKVIGKVNIHPHLLDKKIKKEVIKSPGMKYKHYSPNAKIYLVLGEKEKVNEKIKNLSKKFKRDGNKVGIMTLDKNNNYESDQIKNIGNNLENIAKNLFNVFREFDKDKVDVILAEGISEKGLGLAIMNRLKRATFKVIKV
ncbi:MAG: L-threonylcarbamoyladenylate synthase [Candidatus Pacearchaeota archaeon]|jgi:L-threonylcarbamoyladenylate synthase